MPNNWSRLSLRGIALRISRAWSLSGIRWARLFLVRLGDACTIVTDTITGRSARYIRDKLTEDLIASGLKPVAFPAQLSLTAPLGATGDRELTALFAGQSAALARDTTAAEFVHSLAEETTRCLRAMTHET